jgi:hypothetical protein
MGTTELRSICSLFSVGKWASLPGFELADIAYRRSVEDGTVRVRVERSEDRAVDFMACLPAVD